MPVKKKEFELDDGTTIWVRQASGMEKLKISNIQARIFREFEDKGSPENWESETHQAFSDRLEEEGGGITAQLEHWLRPCVLDEVFDVNLFTIEELMPILNFVRGDDEEGSISFR